MSNWSPLSENDLKRQLAKRRLETIARLRDIRLRGSSQSRGSGHTIRDIDDKGSSSSGSVVVTGTLHSKDHRVIMHPQKQVGRSSSKEKIVAANFVKEGNRGTDIKQKERTSNADRVPLLQYGKRLLEQASLPTLNAKGQYCVQLSESDDYNNDKHHRWKDEIGSRLTRVHKNVRAPFDETVNCAVLDKVHSPFKETVNAVVDHRIGGGKYDDTEQSAAVARTRDALFPQSKRYLSEEMLNAMLDHVPLPYRKRLLERGSLPTPNAKRRRVQWSATPANKTHPTCKPLPGAVATIVRRLRLLDEPDYVKRYYNVVAYCKLANFSFSTTVVYLRLLCDNAELFGKSEKNNSGRNNDDSTTTTTTTTTTTAATEPLRGKDILRRYRLDRAQFKNRVHTRLVDDRSYAIYGNHLLHNLNEYTAPLLLVFYTGLRNVEVRQLTNRSLNQLQNRDHVVTDVMRKRSRHETQKRKRRDSDRDNDDDDDDDDRSRTNAFNDKAKRHKYGSRRIQQVVEADGYGGSSRDGAEIVDNTNAKENVIESSSYTPWMPIYTLQFSAFVDRLCELYARKLTVLRNNVIVSLFDVKSPTTLANRMKCEFFKATGQRLPFGFGLHGNRTTLATLAYERTQDIHFVNRFLGHKSTKTTEIYIKPNVIAMERKFERISRQRFVPLLRNLDRALETAAVVNGSTDVTELIAMIGKRDKPSVDTFEHALFEQTL